MPPGELNDAFMNAMAEICAPLPGAVSLLNALQGKVRMGIITNGFTSLQQTRLERTVYAITLICLLFLNRWVSPSRTRVFSIMRWRRRVTTALAGADGR